MQNVTICVRKKYKNSAFRKVCSYNCILFMVENEITPVVAQCQQNSVNLHYFTSNGAFSICYIILIGKQLTKFKQEKLIN